jgi:hypothetical protein
MHGSVVMLVKISLQKVLNMKESYPLVNFIKNKELLDLYTKKYMNIHDLIQGKDINYKPNSIHLSLKKIIGKQTFTKTFSYKYYIWELFTENNIEYYLYSSKRGIGIECIYKNPSDEDIVSIMNDLEKRLS